MNMYHTAEGGAESLVSRLETSVCVGDRIAGCLCLHRVAGECFSVKGTSGQRPTHEGGSPTDIRRKSKEAGSKALLGMFAEH